MSTNNNNNNNGGGIGGRVHKILEAMGIERNPKTIGGKFLKGFQLVTIPLFIFILATKPYFEERNLSNKLYNERKLEAMEMQKAKERSEKFDKEHPEFAKELENYQNYMRNNSTSNQQQQSTNNTNNKN